MKYTFQHYLDITTSTESVTVIQVQAGGDYAMNRIKHLIGAYKYIKLGRVSVKLLPASTLPVDPLGLSYENTDPQTVDPRDQMNPGLVRITNGEDIYTNISSTGDGGEQMYINTMLDPRWSKFMLQSGFKRSAVPLYWNIGQLAQDPFPGAVQNLPHVKTSALPGEVTGVDSTQRYFVSGSDGYYAELNTAGYFDRLYSDPRGFFQTGHRGRMGWMPTDAFYTTHIPVGDSPATASTPMFQALPEINVITCVFPKAHKTKYYYRMFITETVYLSGLKNTGINDENGSEFRALDNFIRVSMPTPMKPISGMPNQIGQYPSNNDGGGDKS